LISVPVLPSPVRSTLQFHKKKFFIDFSVVLLFSNAGLEVLWLCP